MSSLSRLLLILSFIMFTKMNHVNGDWEWAEENVECLKNQFDNYVRDMENIFSPGGQLGTQSYVLKMRNINMKKMKKRKNFTKFMRTVGEIVERCFEHLNHEFVTSYREKFMAAQGVVITLCTGIIQSCSQISNPMPFGAKLHKTYIMLHGNEEYYQSNCGEYTEDTEPTDSFLRTEDTSGGGIVSRVGSFFSRRFSGRSSSRTADSENYFSDDD